MLKDKKNYNILVIEDNPGDFALIEDLLNERIASAAIVNAKNFKEARLLLTSKSISYDVILLDLTLPDADGETLIAEILVFCPECPVIVLTGFSDIPFSIKSLSLGVADYLLKNDITATSLYKSILYGIERKKSNIALKESEIRYSNLFHLSPQPMWVYNPETYRFMEVNKAATENYGYTKEAFLSMTIMDICPKEDAEMLKKILSEISAHAGNLHHTRVRLYTKSNGLVQAEIYSSPIMINNNLYISVIAIDITEKLLLMQELLNQKVDEQKKIAKAVISAQEKERAGIGAELHDNVSQLLAASKLYLKGIETQPEHADEFLLKTEEYIGSAMNEIRKLSHALVGSSNHKDIWLIDSINELIQDITTVKSVDISFIHGTYHEEDMNAELKLVIYRIIQEQVNNILKHAEASKVEIELKDCDSDLILTINDNGKGFDTSAKREGIGLKNIKNRAGLYNGKVDIVSSPCNGCKMNIYFKESSLIKTNLNSILV